MSYGYSARLIDAINKADPVLLGVRLGLRCVADDTSVTDISRHFNVSTQTVYNWFRGLSSPSGDDLIRRIEAYLG